MIPHIFCFIPLVLLAVRVSCYGHILTIVPPYNAQSPRDLSLFDLRRHPVSNCSDSTINCDFLLRSKGGVDNSMPIMCVAC